MTDHRTPEAGDRPPRPGRAVLIVAAIVVAYCVGVFVLIAEDVLDGGGLLSRDRSVLHWFVDHRTDAWITVARVIGETCGFVGLSLVAVGFGLVLWRAGRPVLLAMSPLVALSLASLASTVTKHVLDRPRPPDALRAAHTSTAAFPSGHSTSAAACFVAIGLVLAIAVVRRPWARVGVIGAGIAAAALVGTSRLVLAVHWLSDVVAGWALGTAFAVTVVVTAWWLVTRPRTTTAT